MFLNKIITFLLMACLSSSCFAWSKTSGGPVSVRGYIKSNGTYVAPHFRSSPDSSVYNNWSTQGNVNLYTGKAGTKPPISKSSPYPNSVESFSDATISTPNLIAPNTSVPNTNHTAQTIGYNPYTNAPMSIKMSTDEISSMEMACIFAKSKGPAQLNACLNFQLATFIKGPRAPDLSGLNANELQSINLACIVAKSNGPSQLNTCLHSQLVSFNRAPGAPDLSGLNANELQSINLACIVAKSNGPSQLNTCLHSQLVSFNRAPGAPDLSGLNANELQSINLACIVAKSNGPAIYNQCLYDQIEAANRLF